MPSAPALPASALMLLLAGCGRGAEPSVDPQSLARRITSLERRVLELEEGRAAQRPAATREGAKGEARVELALTGDAVKVMVRDGKAAWPVPGPVPGGELAVWAIFAEAETPAEVARVTLPASGAATLTCTSTTRTCALVP